MHGIILTELQKFVIQRHGAEAWTETLSHAGLRNSIYLTSATYPDSDVVAIVSRVSPDEVVITYSSERKLCAVAKGIVKGIGAHYQERISIRESECMLTGASVCTISVKLARL